MTTKYAQSTTVTAERSQNEIQATLKRFGADQFIYGWREGGAVIGFRIQNRQVKIGLDLPTEAPEVIPRPEGQKRKTAEEWIEHETMRKWRALTAVIKAKLIAVEEGISTVEREFHADIVLPDGRTMYEWSEPQIEEMYLSGKMPPLLPGPVARLEGATNK